MKYIFLALLITCSSAFAMENNNVVENPAVKLIAATVAAQVTGQALGVSVPFCLTPTLFPVLVPTFTVTAIGVVAYASYKSGEYIYNRYTGSANSQQS